MNRAQSTSGEHTPGEWTRGLQSDQTIYAGDFQVAVVYCERKQWRANADLIAAAPELLTTLEKLAAAAARIVEDDAHPSMEHMRELDRQRAIASQLIAKAKGQP